MHLQMINGQMKKVLILYILLFPALVSNVLSQDHAIVVDASGKGNFKNIQDAINSLPDSSGADRVIRIKKGVYHEKVFITKSYIVLVGEGEKNTILSADIARDIWRCNGHTDD